MDPDVLYVDTGQAITGAGTAAAIDACLYLVRQKHGTAVGNAIARRMVVPGHRHGGQAQYIETPVPRLAATCSTCLSGPARTSPSRYQSNGLPPTR